MSEPEIKKLKLALQGGGTHGAFTWGVLDRLFEDKRLEIEALVGTSAGAMNAVVAAYGLASGGPEQARKMLHDFWKATSDAARFGPLQPSAFDKMFTRGNMDFSPSYLMVEMANKIFSPYGINPTNANPLRDLVLRTVDFAKLRDAKNIKVFVCATNVLNGRLRVFSHNEMSVDAVMASACLPFFFQAVEIDGEYYWDGGYCGNPPIFPVIYPDSSRDVLIVQIEPINIPDVPRTAREIQDRVTALSFNSSLMREIRVIHFITELIDRGELDPEKYQRVFLHTIDAEMELGHTSVSSKLNTDWDFLTYLFKLGRKKAEAFLDMHFEDIGKRTTVDIVHKFI